MSREFTPEELEIIESNAKQYDDLAAITTKVAEFTRRPDLVGKLSPESDRNFMKLLLNFHTHVATALAKTENFVMPYVIGGEPTVTELLTEPALVGDDLADFLANITLVASNEVQD
jgi:hypothetical protein